MTNRKAREVSSCRRGGPKVKVNYCEDSCRHLNALYFYGGLEYSYHRLRMLALLRSFVPHRLEGMHLVTTDLAITERRAVALGIISWQITSQVIASYVRLDFHFSNTSCDLDTVLSPVSKHDSMAHCSIVLPVSLLVRSY